MNEKFYLKEIDGVLFVQYYVGSEFVFERTVSLLRYLRKNKFKDIQTINSKKEIEMTMWLKEKHPELLL